MDNLAAMAPAVQKLVNYGFRVELEFDELIVRTKSGGGRSYDPTPDGAALALRHYESQLRA